MLTAVTVEQMRAAEAAAIAVVGDDALMQRAAAGLATAVLRELPGRVYGARVLVLTGPGNNGGDGLFAGARLARRGVRVEACRADGGVHRRGWEALLASGGREVAVAGAAARIGSYDLVIDAILGIGGRPGLRAPWDALAQDIARSGVRVVACDLPSGISADPPFGVADAIWLGDQGSAGSAEGRASGPGASDVTPTNARMATNQQSARAPGLIAHLRADVTVTFGERKLCHLIEPARSVCGRVESVDIGLRDVAPDVVAWEWDDVTARWPVPGPSAHKYTRGVVGLRTGSERYPGAAVLSATGAVHAGAGMVRYLGPAAVAAKVLDALPSVVVGTGRLDAQVLGCGWGDQAYGTGIVAEAVASGLPLVIDADGLRYLPARLHPGVLLTPHAGELARLLGCDRADVEADPLNRVREAAKRFGATVLLKGATQLVATPDDPVVRVAVPGPAWTAQAGSGDVLAGMCGALLAAGVPPVDAALLAASVQAMAASANPGPLPPQELARLVPLALRG